MKAIVVAPRGKMGKVIVAAASREPELQIIASLGPAGRAYIGKDTGLISGLGEELGAPVVDDLEQVIGDCDVIIDFSTRELSMRVLQTALKHGKALVCGTTGLSAGERAKFAEAAESIPLLYAANTSRLVGHMSKILEYCARSFGEEADIEIIEMHDRDKLDAPSGTSRELGAHMAGAMGKSISDLAVYGRQGGGARKKGEIGYHSVRAGSTPSSHTVIFGFMGERLEIAHHTYNWDSFGSGACKAALYLHGKPAGLYTVREAFGL